MGTGSRARSSRAMSLQPTSRRLEPYARRRAPAQGGVGGEHCQKLGVAMIPRGSGDDELTAASTGANRGESGRGVGPKAVLGAGLNLVDLESRAFAVGSANRARSEAQFVADEKPVQVGRRVSQVGSRRAWSFLGRLLLSRAYPDHKKCSPAEWPVASNSPTQKNRVPSATTMAPPHDPAILMPDFPNAPHRLQDKIPRRSPEIGPRTNLGHDPRRTPGPLA
jgi:hypothetical protein